MPARLFCVQSPLLEIPAFRPQSFSSEHRLNFPLCRTIVPAWTAFLSGLLHITSRLPHCGCHRTRDHAGGSHDGEQTGGRSCGRRYCQKAPLQTHPYRDAGDCSRQEWRLAVRGGYPDPPRERPRLSCFPDSGPRYRPAALVGKPSHARGDRMHG